MAAALPVRPLGSSGLSITSVGFGAWAIGGSGWAFGWGAQEDSESIAAIQHAVASGVGWIDTAAVYGLGHSEEVVGRALRGLGPGERPLVFTKCGRVAQPGRPDVIHTDLSVASIRRECEASLRRLGVEAIDLYQLHWPNDSTGTPLEESWGEMARLAASGLARFVGVSNFSVAELERCEAVRHVDSVQPPLSLLHRAAAADVLPWAVAHGSGVLVYSPMRSGLLTGSFSARRAAALPADDWRSHNPDFQPPALERNLALVEALRPIASRHEVSVGAVAVAWTLAWPGVTGAIVGARSAAQVEGWLPAASLSLTAEDVAEIQAALERTSAGEGPTRP